MQDEINPFQSPLSSGPQSANTVSIINRRLVVPFQSAHGFAIISMVMIGIVCLASAIVLFCGIEDWLGKL